VILEFDTRSYRFNFTTCANS